jgi:acetyl-CoA C-acetyltransferase
MTQGGVDPRAPVIVGAGQITHRHEPGGEFVEPVTLIVRALRAAAQDSGVGEALLQRADSVRAVAVAGWQYRDAAALIAEDLGLAPRETVQTIPFGGDSPQRLINETARSIADGELEVALIGGGEAVATQSAARRVGVTLPWRTQPEGVAPTRISGVDRFPVNDAEMKVGLPAPLDMYALIESALGARLREDPESHLRRISELWSRFSGVAAGNPYAWLPRVYTPEEIRTPSPQNRAVSSPYTKLLSANIQVDQAAALIVCSADAAGRAGIPPERWVFIHAGAQAHDEWHVTERHDFTTSPAIRGIGRAVLEHAGLTIDEIAYIDFYSCFPSAVQIASAELGLPLEDPARPLTVTGGLTFAGGPGNNYAGHGVATLVGVLRDEPEAIGLATALGWYATKHAIGLYSATPPRRPFRSLDPEPESEPPRVARTDYTGPATLEAFTVRRDRGGNPFSAAVSALTPNGERAMVGVTDAELLTGLLERDQLGSPVIVQGPDLFTVV